MKKTLSIVIMATLIMATLILTACGTDDGDTKNVEKVNIKFAVQADSTGALDAIVKEFNEKNEKYEVEAIVLTNDSGNMHDQILNSLSSESGEYDIVSMDVVWAGEFAAAGYLEPIDSIIKDAGWKISDFNAGSMASGKYKGKNYALPYFSDLGFLYYRSDIVSEDDAKKLENGDYTWNELLNMAESYKDEKETKYGFVYQSKQYEGLTVNLNEFSNNWQDIKGGLEMMKRFTDSEATPDDILNYTEGETHAAFINGETVFARNWPYMNGMIAAGDQVVKSNQIGYAKLPNGGSVGGWLLGLNKSTKNKEGAVEFLKFIAGPEGQKINSTAGGYLPGFNKLLDDKEVQGANALLTSDSFKKALSTTIARPVSAEYSKTSDTIQIKTHEYLSGNGSLDNAVKEIEATLK